ncbi:MAG: 6-phospho-3-hexuloisomerase [Alphaproteobacteria bacterium]|nr:6-phospho-3-hexuloisomerase [Alphaproteobacteria bacterium]
MSAPSLRPVAAALLAEVEEVFARMAPDAAATLAGELVAARRILLHSAGRTGLVLRGLTMRLFHAGLDAHMVGDMTAPPVGAGDLLLVNASTGDLPSGVAHATAARAAGARVLVVGAVGTGAVVDLAHRFVLLPGQTMRDDMTSARPSAMPMGSQYELALAVFFEIVVLEVMRMRGLGFADLRARHANLL